MIYIYNDFGGTHSTSLAAAFHLSLLSKNQKLTKNDILNVPYFNQLSTKDKGIFIFHGLDDLGNHVYTVGRRSSDIAVTAMVNLSKILNEECHLNQKVIFSNTSPTVSIPMTIGGFLSRVLKLDFLGVPFLIWGAKISYKDIVQLVEHTKEVASNVNDLVINLDNKKYK